MIKENILGLRQHIAASCLKVNRNPSQITLVAVTKTRTCEQIQQAVNCGITDIGENRVQEAIVKYNKLQISNFRFQIKWHMVGHLQTNKVKQAVKIFDLIHSVDSVKLAAEINRQASKINKIQEILLEVKTSAEAAKFGLKPEEAIPALEEMGSLPNIKVRGLMTIAPLVEDPEGARSYFRQLRELSDKIIKLSTIDYRLWTLSMGMSDDFQVAVEEGANMLRLGRAIFEE